MTCSNRFLDEPGNLFKGPFASVLLPFCKGLKGRNFFFDLQLRYPAYLHQEKAFQRLAGTPPKPTIIATGTGSGKTGCFLFPILNHCLKNRGEKGIKAILIYPMNALANDQTVRLARTIRDNPKLQNQLSAGLYVGQRESSPAKVMTREGIITDREILRKQPPDILLTNYKMLDYLMIRPQDTPLWSQQNPESLQFLVVDELHTFDGAQGTDLACLIRRLKERLRIPDQFLCPIGTSATLGDASSVTHLLAYATSIFGETFDESAIISKDRLGPGEFLEDALVTRVEIPPRTALDDLQHRAGEPSEDFIRRQISLWFGTEDGPVNPVSLSELLRGHLFFQNFLKIMRNRILSLDEIIEQLSRFALGGSTAEPEYVRALLNSLLALVSAGRRVTVDEASPDQKIEEPFRHVRLHLWIRELRRLVADVGTPSHLRFLDDLKEEDRKRHLPIVHCRECGATGWIGLTSPTSTHIQSGPADLYSQYFERSEQVAFLFPQTGSAGEKILPANRLYICPSCLHLQGNDPKGRSCPSCHEGTLLQVFRPDPESMIVGRGRSGGRYDCPYCQGSNSFSIIGSQAATLTSVMISQLFSSRFNDDRRLMTFSDSVQDAAHSAGFFGARTWQFNFRSALLQAVINAKIDLSLPDIVPQFQAFWNRQLSPEAYATIFLPPQNGLVS
ncbi:MAG: DEAD/DEAH box helicase [Candidatus Ozemobacteraceae bacterium]